MSICEIKEKAIELMEMGLSQDVKDINAKELFQLMDIIKDAEETIYYQKIIESMEKYPEEYEKKYAPDYQNMHYSSYSEEKTLEDYMNDILDMMSALDATEKASAKQKLVQFVNKI